MEATRLSLDLGPAAVDVRLAGLPSDLLNGLSRRPSASESDIQVTIRAAGPIPRPASGDCLALSTPFFAGFWDRASASADVTLTPMDPTLCAPGRQCHGVLRLVLSTWIREQGGIVLHGAALTHDGGAHVFLGASGAGKTTLARRFPETLRLGDDYIALLPGEKTGFDVQGTSLRGRERLRGSLTRHPLHSIAILEQRRAPSREALAPSSAVEHVLRHAFAHHQCSEERSDHLKTALALVAAVPVSRLGMTRTSDPFLPAVAP